MQIEGIIWLRRRENTMAEGKARKIPHFASLDELVDFFDTHDMGEYLDQMPESHFEVDIKKHTHLFAIDEDIVEKLTEIASSKQASSEELINSLLREKILSQS